MPIGNDVTTFRSKKFVLWQIICRSTNHLSIIVDRQMWRFVNQLIEIYFQEELHKEQFPHFKGEHNFKAYCAFK